jgi:hypothetical protein
MPKKYTSIGGSIFRGSKQLMILVEVECSATLRDEIADLIVQHLNRKKK